MKRILIIALLTAAISNVSFTRELVAEGRTYSSLGDYRIELSDNPMMINGNQFKVMLISYQNVPLEVRVAIGRERGARMYYVLTDELCVQYVSNSNYFGVERLNKSFEKDGYSTSDANLNREEYFHQKVITSGQGTDIDNTRLIASYFPMLIKNQEPVAAR